MSSRGKEEKIQIGKNPISYGQMNLYTDKRVKMIYDRFRTGKSIIIDDLRYLWSKDQEGCDKLAKYIVESKSGKGQKVETGNLDKISYTKINSENIKSQKFYIDYKSGEDTIEDTVMCVPEIIASVKLLINKMSHSEQKDISVNLYEAIEIKKITEILKDWDDTFTEKMIMNTSVIENKFDKMA